MEKSKQSLYKNVYRASCDIKYYMDPKTRVSQKSKVKCVLFALEEFVRNNTELRFIFCSKCHRRHYFSLGQMVGTVACCFCNGRKFQLTRPQRAKPKPKKVAAKKKTTTAKKKTTTVKKKTTTAKKKTTTRRRAKK